MKRYPIPAAETHAEIMVVNSRFIATAGPAFSIEEAKEFIARIKAEYADATHNVPAFLIGHGASVTAHCHDDGEPSGTAGRPVLTVLTGSGFGDVVVVVTRYFGGTKLGTGGLVRAYGDAAKAVIANLPRAERVSAVTVMIAIPYAWLERLRILIQKHFGKVLDESFAADITVTAQFSEEYLPGFQAALLEASHGTLQGEIIETGEILVPIGQFNPPGQAEPTA